MTVEHNDVMTRLGFMLYAQLDPTAFVVRVNTGRTQRTDARFSIPDVMVIPSRLTKKVRGRADHLAAYTEPLPLIAVRLITLSGQSKVSRTHRTTFSAYLPTTATSPGRRPSSITNGHGTT